MTTTVPIAETTLTAFKVRFVARDAKLLHPHGGVQLALHGATRRTPVGSGRRSTFEPSLVEEVRRSGRKHVVLTGGEPFMFPGLTELNDALRSGLPCHD